MDKDQFETASHNSPGTSSGTKKETVLYQVNYKTQDGKSILGLVKKEEYVLNADKQMQTNDVG